MIIVYKFQNKFKSVLKKFELLWKTLFGLAQINAYLICYALLSCVTLSKVLWSGQLCCPAYTRSGLYWVAMDTIGIKKCACRWLRLFRNSTHLANKNGSCILTQPCWNFDLNVTNCCPYLWKHALTFQVYNVKLVEKL